MIAVFIAAEAGSARYGPRIRELLAGLGQPHGIAEHPDTGNATANAARRRVLAAYRGYPAGDVFTGLPADISWHHAALTPAELATVRYLDYDYWTDFSGGSRLAADGARRLGPLSRLPPGAIYRQVAENLRDGKLPPPVILLSEPGLANLIVIEGHKRITGLLLCPQWLPAELQVLLGITARHRK